jgi:hypothetical protein
MVDENGPYSELAEGIGAIGDHRKHAASAKQIDRIGLG